MKLFTKIAYACLCTTLQHFIHQAAPRSPCDFSYTRELSFCASFADHIYTLLPPNIFHKDKYATVLAQITDLAQF